MSEQAARKIPPIRMKGFEREWEEKALGELLSFRNGYNAAKFEYGSGRKFINVLDIMENSFITHDRIIGRVNIPDRDFGRYEVKFGDILFQRSSETREEVGQANVYLDMTKTAAFGGFVIRGRPLVEFDSEFFNCMLKSAGPRREITSRSGGSTRYNIGQESLGASLVTIAPTLTEQGGIGDYFRELDRLLALHQRKHDKLAALKRAMLQRMFPQPGATTPEIRFNGFSNPWNSEVMSKIGQPYTGLTGKTKADFGHGLGRYVTYMSVFGNAISSLCMTGSVPVDERQNEVKKGDVFFTISSETPNEVGMSSVWMDEAKNVYLNSFCFGFRPSPKFCSEFLAYLFRAHDFRGKVALLAQGISRYNISKAGVMDISVRIPEYEEQRKIGAYFRALDKLISQHVIQLQKLQQIKSACLEKMFV